jgi:WD40 repeat protein
MNGSNVSTDELIQAAFERRARRGDAAGLRENIVARTAGTPQRGVWRDRFTASLVAFPRLRPAWVALLVVIALLAAALGFAVIGHQPRTPLRDGSWIDDASMAHAIEGFTATLLNDGRVLVTGGSSGTIVALCELYDPSTGAWTPTGGMTEARYSFITVRLPDGTVLAAGGWNSTSTASLRSAEIYDPSTESWTRVGPMVEARAGFTATLLPNGMVLVVGGIKDRGSTQGVAPNGSAELYDPSSRSWTATGSVLVPRDGFTATLLPSGRVLVAGGNTSLSEPATAIAELYDPNTGSWARTGTMLEARVAAAAALLPDGEVLVAGGHSGSGLHNSALSSAERYSPASGSWTTTGSMEGPDALMAATLLPDGRVLVTGGFENDVLGVRPELYDPIGRSWTSAGIGSTRRTMPTATLMLDGKVLVAGGTFVGSPWGTSEIYDPSGGT